MFNSVVLASASAFPERCLKNDDLAKMVETSDEWIVKRTGINQRFILQEGVGVSSLGVRAAREAIKNANLHPNDIDLLIFATTTPDKTLPSTAAIVQGSLGMSNESAAFDINAVCSGFIYALTVADTFIKCGRVKRALVIGADAMSSIVDWSDRGTCVLFGDGAGALILGASEEKNVGIIASDIYCDGRLENILDSDGGTSTTRKNGFVRMNGRQVFNHAIEKMSLSIENILKKSNLTIDDVDLIIPHQANQRIIIAVAERLSFDENKVVNTVGIYANTSAATIPSTWHYATKNNMIKKGQTIVITAMGAGATWGAAVIKV